MAVFSFVAVPGGTATSKTNVSAASSAEIVLGKNCVFMIVCDADLNLAFGVSGMSAAAAGDLLIPAKVPMAFDLSDQFDRVRVFGTGNAYIRKLAKC